MFLRRFRSQTSWLAWPCIWLLWLASIPLAKADIEVRVDPERAGHGFGAILYGQPTSNGSSEGIHYDQNGRPYLKHMATLHPEWGWVGGTYEFFDATVNEVVPLSTGDVVNGVADLRGASYTNRGGGPGKHYFAVPSDRTGNQLVVVHVELGITIPLTMTSRWVNYSNGTFLEAYADFEWWGTWYVHDPVAHESAPAWESFLVEANWTTDWSDVFTDPVVISLSDGEAGYHYTLHYQFPGGEEMLHAAIPELNPSLNISLLYGNVPRGANWWLTRNVDNEAYHGTPTTEPGEFYVDLRDYMPARQRETREFYVDATTGGSYTVRQAHAQFPAHWSSAHGVQSMPVWNNYGYYDSFSYLTYVASIDSGMGFALERVETGQTLPEWESIWWGNFQPHQPPPNEQLVVDVFHASTGALYIQAPDGSGNYAHAGGWMSETLPSVWPSGPVSSYLLAYYRYVSSVPMIPGNPQNYWQLTTYNEWGWGNTFQVTSGYQDYRHWYPQPALLQVEISTTRYGHDLRVRQPHTGSEYYLNQLGTPGYYYENGQQTYGYVWTEGYYTPGFDFWIYDATTGETAPLNTANLATWVDLRAPTLESATDLGTGTVSLMIRFNSDYANSVSLERRLADHSDEWTVVGGAQLSGATWGNTFEVQDTTAYNGETFLYRVRSVMGSSQSAPSNEMSVSVGPTSLNADYLYFYATLMGQSASAARLEWASNAPSWEGYYVVQSRTGTSGPWRNHGVVFAEDYWNGFFVGDIFYSSYRYEPVGLTPGKTYYFRVRMVRDMDDYFENPSPQAILQAPVDTDGDGIPDQDEIAVGTDPTDPDSDNDGFSDGEELAGGTDPNNPNSHPNPGNPGTPGGGGPPGNPPANPENAPHLPEVIYTGIDLTEITGVNASSGLAYGDNGKIAFYEKIGTSYYVAVWNEGDGSYQKGVVPDRDPDGAPLYVVGINSEGMLAGNTLGYDEHKRRTISVAFKATPSWGGGPPAISYPFLSPHSDCFVEFNHAGCDEPDDLEIVDLPSVVEGVSRMSGPWGTNVAWKKWDYSCDDCCGGSYGYETETKSKYFSWDQIFYGDGTVMPDVEASTEGLDTNSDGKVDEDEMENLTLTYTPDPYLDSLVDVSFGGGSPYGHWSSAESFTIGTSPAPTDLGNGFQPNQNGPGGVEVNKTSDMPQGVSGLDLVTDAVQALQEKLPSEWQEYVIVTAVHDNANGDTILAQAQVWTPPLPSDPPADPASGTWEDSIILIKNGNAKKVKPKNGSPIQANSGKNLAGKNGSKALAMVQAEVQEVEFSGTKYHELVSDDGTVTYSVPHWKDGNGDGKMTPTVAATGDRNYPIAFTRNSQPQIGGKFKFDKLPQGKTFYIKAESNAIVKTLPIAFQTSAGPTQVDIVQELSPDAFPNEIKFYNASDGSAFKIKWMLSIDGQNFKEFAETKHTLYLVWKDPILTAIPAAARKETLYNVGCRNAQGKGNVPEKDIVTAIYADFQDQEVYRVEPATGDKRAVEMSFWGDPAEMGSATHLLLKDGDGKCGSWCMFFIDVLRSQGINAQLKAVVPKPPTVAQFQASVDQFAPPGVGYAAPALRLYINTWVIPANPFASTPGFGIASQGIPNSQKRFNDHGLVEYDNELYDPSYGHVPVGNLKDWEKKALAGVGLWVSVVGPGIPPGTTADWIGIPENPNTEETVIENDNY